MGFCDILIYIFKIILITYLVITSKNYDLRRPIEFLQESSSEFTLFLNKNDQFPIPKPCKVLLIGSGARHTIKGGLGSGDVDSNFTTCEQGLEKAGFTISSLSKKWFDDYISIKQNNLQEHLNNITELYKKSGHKGTFSMVSFPEVEYNLNIIKNEKEKSDIAIYVLARNMGEGLDRRPIKGEVFLTETEINDILFLDKNYKKFILVLNVGGIIDLSPVQGVSNILLLSQLGSVTGDVLADIILGKSNPSGKLASTWSKYNDYKFIDEFGDLDETNYLEGIYVGYRYFDSVGVNPLYPFGYGKSYTEFALSKLDLTNYKDEITIKVIVENTGKFIGKEVIQIYISQSQENEDKPYQSLVAFCKTKNIEPGKSENIKIKFKLKDVARYDTRTAQYILDKGIYIIRVGNNSRDTKIYGYVNLDEDIIVEKIKNIIGKPDFEDFKPNINLMNDINKIENYQCIKLTKEDFDFYKTVNYTYIAAVSNKLLNLSNEVLMHLCLGNFIVNISEVNDPIISKEKEMGLAGTTTKNVSKIKKYLTMADGPAGLRLSKVYGIDNAKLYHRMDDNIVQLMSYRTLVKQDNISLSMNTTTNINLTQYPKIKFQYPIAIPIATAIAQTFNSRLVKQFGKIVGKDMKRFDVDFWLAPAMNIHRNPLCGRNFEYYSEDPFLAGKMAAAAVRGIQSRGVAASLKHFTCNNKETNRRESDSRVSERALREIYLKAFEICVKEAQPWTIMSSYNIVNGLRASENRELLTDILRGEWGYKGIVVSDCWALDDFYMDGRHGYMNTGAETAAAAVKNGVDVECGEDYKYIPDAIAQGLLDVKDLDRNLLRVLTERIRLGEMDGLSPLSNLDTTLVECAEHRALSRKMASETMVLLLNRGGILPLSGTERIAVVGPNANDREMMWGNYNPVPKHTTTLLDALRERIPGIEYIKGCGIVDGLEEDVADRLSGADVVIFAGGISPRFEGEEMPVEVPGFDGGDRTDIELPAVQRELLRQLHLAGKKVVLVNFSGSAMGLVPETESCDAILQAWYPGEEGGPAIADVLFGDVNPSGKLPVTFYRSVADLPEVEDYNMEGHTYRFFRGEPLYPFGFGLSYTTFEYGEASVKRGQIVIPVTNTGACDGTEVIQLYVSRPSDSEGPVKTLRGFKRVNIPAGESVNVSIPLNADTFLWWDESAQNMVPLKGEYKLLYGGSSAAVKEVSYRF